MASELLLSSGWDQDVAVSLQNVPIIGFGPREAHDGAVVLHQEPARQQNETKQQAGGADVSRKAAACLPACSPPAVWGRYHQGCRWRHQFPPRQHTWLQTCAGTSWSEDPHYQSPKSPETRETWFNSEFELTYFYFLDSSQKSCKLFISSYFLFVG